MTQKQRNRWTLLLVLAGMACSEGYAQRDRITALPDGVQMNMAEGKLAVQFVDDDIVRIRFTLADEWSEDRTIICLPHEHEKTQVRFRQRRDGDRLFLYTDSLNVSISLATGCVSFADAVTGRCLLKEDETRPHTGEKRYLEKVTYDESTRRKVMTADGEKWIADVSRRDTLGTSWKYRAQFDFTPAANLYGLGSHMEDYLNLRHKKLYLCQHNLKAVVPVLVSSSGFGLLFDAGCSLLFDDTGKDRGYMELDAAKEIDYYFMKGAGLDRIVAQYRRLTGKSPMLPRYAFGYIQSKERYRSSEELVNTVKEYRKRQIPLDLIVQDWNYWPQGWGYIKMDRRFYPDPKLLADSIHALNARLMVSIWPNPQNCPQTDDFRKKGYMLPSGATYDAFSDKARAYYWTYVDNEFFSKGFDAWWCDCTEPVDGDWKVMPEGYGWDSHEERWKLNTAQLGDALGAERANMFSLYHSKGIYENQRLTDESKRVMNLTRSAYAGQQRYATVTWSGDTYATWEAFARQIPAGLNFMATGCPYWTVDIGAFFTVTANTWFRGGDYPKGVADLGYREFYTRMLQYGTFMPLMRSHGTDTPREIWQFGRPGEMFYDAIAKYIRLRYQFLPYTYSLAGSVTRDDYTPVRLLAFDFAHDTKVFDLKDEFMFGPSLLVCPVTQPMYYGPDSAPLQETEKTRGVYLPEGRRWTDFWTGKVYEGGKAVAASAPIETIPLFVPDGSILPMGPVVQYAAEQTGKKLTLHIYPGRDTSFLLYEDEGDNYNYEKGRFSTISLNWNEKKQTLDIGHRQGTYDGMPQERDFCIVLHRDGATVSKEVHYGGKAVKCKF